MSTTWNYTLEPEGLCPVQAEGKLASGEIFYFRMRNEIAAIYIGVGQIACRENEAVWFSRCVVLNEHISRKSISLLIDTWIRMYSDWLALKEDSR